MVPKYEEKNRITFPSYCWDQEKNKIIRFFPSGEIYEVGFSTRHNKVFYWCNQHQVDVPTRKEISDWLEADTPSFVWEESVIGLVN